MSYSLRVWKNPTLISSLTHGLTFATDKEINDRMLLKYRNFDYLTHSDNANTYMLQSVIAEWKHYAEELYATTQYDYDPLLNYDMREEGSIIDEHHKGNKRAYATDLKDSRAADQTITETPRVKREEDVSGFGLGSTASGTPTEHRVTEDTDGTNVTRTQAQANANYSQKVGLASANYETQTDIDANTFDNDVHTFDDYRKYGNLGVVKPQDMIEAQRRIITDVIDVYISKFADCFNISSFIACEPFEEVET